MGLWALPHIHVRERGERHLRPVGISRDDQSAAQSRQNAEIFSDTIDVTSRLGATRQLVADVTALDTVGGLDRTDVRHQCRQLGTGRLDDSRQVRPGPQFLVGHRSPPACRKLSAAATSSRFGDCRPARSHKLHATRNVRSTPRMLNTPRSRAVRSGVITACGGRNRRRSSGPLTSAFVRTPYGAHRSAAACRAAATRSRTIAVASPWSAFMAADRTGSIWTRRSTRSSSGPDSLPRYRRFSAAAQLQSRGSAGAHGHGIRSKDELKPGRVPRHAVAAGKPDLPVLQRSSQRFQGTPAELRALVEEQTHRDGRG